MRELIKAKEPFKFSTRLHLQELTGLKAFNLVQLTHLLQRVSGSVIYHHTHRFLQQHLYLSPEPPNDFAYWVTQALGEDALGERLASIDTVEYPTIRSLREKIIQTIEGYIQKNPSSKLKFASSGDELHFIKTISFILPTPYEAQDLQEFISALEKVTLSSIYFHVFEARLRLERGKNDFSYWIDTSLGDSELSRALENIDPYTQTVEGLRRQIIGIVKARAES